MDKGGEGRPNASAPPLVHFLDKHLCMGIDFRVSGPLLLRILIGVNSFDWMGGYEAVPNVWNGKSTIAVFGLKMYYDQS
jgi:hypothetical protein